MLQGEIGTCWFSVCWGFQPQLPKRVFKDVWAVHAPNGRDKGGGSKTGSERFSNFSSTGLNLQRVAFHFLDLRMESSSA